MAREIRLGEVYGESLSWFEHERAHGVGDGMKQAAVATPYTATVAC